MVTGGATRGYEVLKCRMGTYGAAPTTGNLSGRIPRLAGTGD